MPAQKSSRRSASAAGFLAGLVLALLPGFTVADGGGERFVTLRDGSLLRVDLGPAPPLAWDGTQPPVAVGDIAEATFALKPAGAVIREIRKQVAALSSKEFAERQAASVRLLEIAPGFGALLAELEGGSDDPEIRLRLTAILNKIPPHTASGVGFDLIVTSGGDRFTGDIGDWSATVNYRGHKLELSRKNLARIAKNPPEPLARSPLSFSADGTDAVFTELRKDDDASLPADLFRTGFETDPDGVPLKIGEDISARFTSAGFQIATSIKGAIVSVNDFVVQGRSKGLSAATHSPLWEGTLTVRFHAPGRPGIPAFVSSAGFWVASVSPNGTALEAYDATGNLVGTVKTKLSGNEFLAFRSPVPIAEIRIVPNIPVDPNYTIDDLFFSRPVAAGIRPEAGWGVFQTKSGERFLARDFEPADREFTLKTLSFGADSIRLDPRDISAFAPPPFKVPAEAEPVPADIHWIMLDDGTRLRATRRGFPEHRWATIPEFALPQKRITALWGIARNPLPPPESNHAFLRDSKGAVTPAPTAPERWIRLEMAFLGEAWIESPNPLAKRPGYHDSDVVWFGMPPKPSLPTGRLILSSGEQIPLSKPGSEADKIWVRSVGEGGIHLSMFGQNITIPMEKVVSCHYPED